MDITENVDLAHYTTLKVGGPARYFTVVQSVDELEQARQFAQQTDVPVVVFGQGSNVLVSEHGYDGLVIINQILGKSYQEESTATFGAGENWDDVVADTVAQGLWGLENLSHIPGTVGATPVQNVGAYGVEVSDLITSVEAFSLQTGAIKTFQNSECKFAYRDSYFKTDTGRDWIITSVTFSLSRDSSAAVLGYADLRTFTESKMDFTQLELRNEIIRIRSQKFPDWQQVGTAGSFFKNPIVSKQHLDELLTQYPDLPHFLQPNGKYKIALGWILDKICNLRGYCDGEVCLSQHQALVLLNHGTSAGKVIEFVSYVQTEVYKKTKIKIEPEVRFV
jgi:UDP-N-acetylmuramate dehydrogenase